MSGTGYNLNEPAKKALLWIGRTGGVQGYGTSPNYIVSKRLAVLGFVRENFGRPGHYRLTEKGKIAYQFLEDERASKRAGRDPQRRSRTYFTVRSSRFGYTATLYKNGRAVNSINGDRKDSEETIRRAAEREWPSAHEKEIGSRRKQSR